MLCSENEQPGPTYADPCTLFKRDSVPGGVCPRSLQLSMAAGYPAMGHRIVSPQEGVDQQAKRRGRTGHSATSSLLFWAVVCKEQPEEFWLSKVVFKAIIPVLVDVTYGLVQEINQPSTSQMDVGSTQLCLPFRQRG